MLYNDELFNVEGKSCKRVNKTRFINWLKNEKNHKKIFAIAPCKARLDSPWHLACIDTQERRIKEYGEKAKDINSFVSNFKFYNCGYNELGLYPSYYIEI